MERENKISTPLLFHHIHKEVSIDIPEMPNLFNHQLRIDKLKEEIARCDEQLKKNAEIENSHSTTVELKQIDELLANHQTYYDNVDKMSMDFANIAESLCNTATALRYEAEKLENLATEYGNDALWCRQTIREEIPREELKKKRDKVARYQIESLSRLIKENYMTRKRIEDLNRRIKIIEKDKKEVFEKYEKRLNESKGEVK